jgi:hypothetical protein
MRITSYVSLQGARGPQSVFRQGCQLARYRVDTFVISVIVTEKATTAGLIAATEVLTKIVLFYFHERIWGIVPWGHISER